MHCGCFEQQIGPAHVVCSLAKPHFCGERSSRMRPSTIWPRILRTNLPYMYSDHAVCSSSEFLHSNYVTQLFIHIVCGVMEPFSSLLSLSLSLLFLYVHAEMSSSCQSSNPLCAHPSVEISSLLAKPITYPLLSASQLTS